MKGFRLGFITFVLCALALPVLGANRMYVKFEGPDIRGGSTAPGHSGEIEVLGWNHGFERPADPRSTGGGTVEQATHHDFTFVKSFDSATDELMKYMWSGKQIRKVTLTCYRGDDTSVPMLTVVMEKLVISGWKTSGGTNGAGTETISLDYGTIKYTYSGGKQTVRVSRQAATSGLHDVDFRLRSPSPSVPLCLRGEYERASKLRARLSQEATLRAARDAGIHHRDTKAQRGTEGEAKDAIRYYEADDRSHPQTSNRPRPGLYLSDCVQAGQLRGVRI